MKKELLLFFTFTLTLITYAQEFINDTIARTATINASIKANTVLLTPETPVLNQIAGAPKAFYTHYWEFGDGYYSTEEKPKHTYKNQGEYEIKLWSTNNYDTGKPPTSRPKKVTINTIESTFNDVATMQENFILKRNREPLPNQEIVTIMSYKNTKPYPTNGKLYLFYNELKYKANNFELTDTRTYYNEKKALIEEIVFSEEIEDNDILLASNSNDIFSYNITQQDSTIKTNLPLTIEESKNYYKDWSILEFNDMLPNEERNVFFSLKTTPEMVKDTSAIISVRGIYVPDSDFDNHKIKDMEMEIVTSHDPNKMSSNGTLINYRLAGLKKLKYKIKFQNNGEGPAQTIRLETDIPNILDKNTIEVIDMYPKCKICPKYDVDYSCLDTTFTEKQVIFTFKNIYLPGSEQENIKEYDSTKGFVKYRIKFAKKSHKVKTKSRTAIIFDKNDPIITNYSTTRFSPGISIGAKAGYNLFNNLKNSESYFIGATLSPYKSYRWYWQVELMNNFHNYETNITVNELVEDSTGFSFFQSTSTQTFFKNIDLDVPILIRYNINNYIGLGAGFQNTLSVSEKQNQLRTVNQYEGKTIENPIYNSIKETNTENNSFTNLRTGLLFDATFGIARIGPSLGARYIMNFKNDFSYWQCYAVWKF